VSIRFFLAFLLLSPFVFGVRPIGTPYNSYESFEVLMDDFVSLYGGDKVVAGYTIEGRPISLYRFGNPQGGVFFFDGRMHGPEDCGSESGLHFLEWVFESEDPDARFIRGNAYLLFMPGINRDHESGRQNKRRVNSDGSFVPYGVDLNRNFPHGWGGSGSGDPLNAYEYRGEGPGSEPETEAVLGVLEAYRPGVYVNVHCGMIHLSGSGDYNLTSRVLDGLKDTPAQEFYNPYRSSGCGAGGYAKASGCGLGWSSWLFEVVDWPGLPDDVSGYRSSLGPYYLPVYESFALAAASIATPEGEPSKEPLKEPELESEIVFENSDSDWSPEDDTPLFRDHLFLTSEGGQSVNFSDASDQGVIFYFLVQPLSYALPFLGIGLLLYFLVTFAVLSGFFGGGGRF